MDRKKNNKSIDLPEEPPLSLPEALTPMDSPLITPSTSAPVVFDYSSFLDSMSSLNRSSDASAAKIGMKRISSLTVENYPEWTRALKSVCLAAHCWMVIERVLTKPPNPLSMAYQVWSQATGSATLLLSAYIGEEAFNLISELQPFDTWKVLVSQYGWNGRFGGMWKLKEYFNLSLLEGGYGRTFG